MYLALGRAEPTPRVTTETPGPVSPMALQRVLDPKTREFGAICRIVTRMGSGYSLGTGVLVTPHHVLTCAHVIRPPQDPDNIMSITVFVAQNGPADQKHGIKANGWAVAPGWIPLDCRTYDRDFGIIRLSKAATTSAWPVAPFDARRLTGKAAYLAGYPVLPNDREAQFMFRSRGAIGGSMTIRWCRGQTQTLWGHQPGIDDTTRLVRHRLDTRTSMSGGPMWSFVDNHRILWGLHGGVIEANDRRAILLNRTVLAQIARWVSTDLPAL